MKLTEAKLKTLILETMEEEREFDFSEMIRKDLDYETLRSTIELLLDAEDVEYKIRTYGGDSSPSPHFDHNLIYRTSPPKMLSSANYSFAEPLDPSEADYYWKKPFEALVNAFNKAGIPNQDDLDKLKTKITTPSYRASFGINNRALTIFDNS